MLLEVDLIGVHLLWLVKIFPMNGIQNAERAYLWDQSRFSYGFSGGGEGLVVCHYL